MGGSESNCKDRNGRRPGTLVVVLAVVVTAWSVLANIVGFLNIQQIKHVSDRVSINTPLLMDNVGAVGYLKGAEQTHQRVHASIERELESLRLEIQLLREKAAPARSARGKDRGGP